MEKILYRRVLRYYYEKRNAAAVTTVVRGRPNPSAAQTRFPFTTTNARARAHIHAIFRGSDVYCAETRSHLLSHRLRRRRRRHREHRRTRFLITRIRRPRRNFVAKTTAFAITVFLFYRPFLYRQIRAE